MAKRPKHAAPAAPAIPPTPAPAPQDAPKRKPPAPSIFEAQRAAYERLHALLADAQASGQQTVAVETVLGLAAGHWPEVEAYRASMDAQGVMTLGVLANLIGSLPIPPKVSR